MNKRDYFLLAYRNRMHLHRWWLLRTFSPPSATPENDLYGINETNLATVGYVYVNDKGQYVAVDEDCKPRIIDGVTPGSPLFGIKETVTFQPGDLLIIKEKTDTFYSNAILNIVLFEYPFKDKIPYQNKRLKAETPDDLVLDALKDKRITVAEYRAYTRACGYITCLATVCAPTATEKSIIAPKQIHKLRDQLIKENKDKLTDPVTVSNIESQLYSAYKEHIKGDEFEGFMASTNKLEVSIKKAYLTFGAEPSLDDPKKVTMATRSLSEGLDIKDFPAMANSLRMGSYNRGKETQLGGEAAKFNNRIFQNTEIVEEDCKTTVYLPVWVTEHNKDRFIGRYIVNKDQLVLVSKPLTPGSWIMLRSPQTCKTTGGNFCRVCMGKEIQESVSKLGPMVAEIGGIFLKQSLAKFHAAMIKTSKYDYKQSIY